MEPGSFCTRCGREIVCQPAVAGGSSTASERSTLAAWTITGANGPSAGRLSGPTTGGAESGESGLAACALDAVGMPVAAVANTIDSAPVAAHNWHRCQPMLENHQAQSGGGVHGFPARMHGQLAVDVLDMLGHRMGGDEE